MRFGRYAAPVFLEMIGAVFQVDGFVANGTICKQNRYLYSASTLIPLFVGLFSPISISRQSRLFQICGFPKKNGWGWSWPAAGSLPEIRSRVMGYVLVRGEARLIGGGAFIDVGARVGVYWGNESGGGEGGDGRVFHANKFQCCLVIRVMRGSAIEPIINNNHTMQQKQKQLKMLYVVGTYDAAADSAKISTQPVTAVTKRQFKLLIGEVGQQLSTDQVTLSPIEQEKSKAGHYQATFLIKRETSIKKEEIMVNFPLACILAGNKLTIPEEEFRRITYEFKRLYQRDESEEEENSEGESKEELSHRGRGRPKGSKNKKKDQNGEQSSDESFSHCSDYKKQEKKPGKGRPKGSRNKKKDVYDELLHESNFQALFKKIFLHRSFEEINKRMNRDYSKSNKDETVKLEDNYDECQAKRSRGRPKGVKNKKNKIEEDGESEQNMISESIPEREPLKKIPRCCSKCDEREFKRQYLEGKLRNRAVLKNLAVNIGVEDTKNVMIEIIRSNHQADLRQLLRQVHEIESEFLVPWDCGSRLENAGYTIRTRKDYLIRHQKEMINALLQDRFVHSGSWWQVIGVDRLLESIPRYEEGIEIYHILVEHEKALEGVFLQNIPTLVRCGNEALSRYLIEKVLGMEENAMIYGYSREHLECLDKNRTQLQFRKAAMLKQNCTQNFCSPIHCATINSNTELLTYILKHISEFNVGDSLNRKPVHYAATLESPKAIEILHKHNSEQLTQMDKKKVTPLMVAAQHGRYSVIKFILEKLRDKEYINHKSDEGLSALHYAVIHQHEECVSLLLEDHLVNPHEETKERFSILHLAAGGGNKSLVQLIMGKGIRSSFDNFRRSPLVVALRNHHNDIFFQLLKEAQGSFKRDYSNNTMLHYAAAYGNIELVMFLRKIMEQIPNKKNFYPWEVAVLKGHFHCAQLLEMKGSKVINFPHHHHLIFLLLKNPRGTPEFFKMIEYLLSSNIYQLNYQYTSMGDTCLHLLCSISEKDYYEQRTKESSYIRPNEYQEMQGILIKQLLAYGADSEIMTEKQHKPVNYCIENENSIGIQLLMKEIPFDIQPPTKNNHFVYYLTNIACRGKAEVFFVLDKLSQVDPKVLRLEFRKADCFGFEFIVFLMKNFTQTVHSNFRRNYVGFLNEHPEAERESEKVQEACIQKAFGEYVEHETSLLKLVGFLVENGADPRSMVCEPRVENENENYKKWGIQHFLMRFPSLVLLKNFMKWIDKFFNSQNSEGRTPLHLFCMWNREGSLFNTEEVDMRPVPRIRMSLGPDYDSHKCLEYLLENGLTSNILDINRSTPLLYAALNGQLKFMNLLRAYGSTINNCNLLNQVPLIEIIKNKQKFSVQEIESILGEHGASADIRDLNDRNALHHLVSNATNFDSSPEICMKLLEYGVKINSLDKYGRTPIFYCFIKIKGEEQGAPDEPPNDKVEIMQTLLNCSEIDLSIVDYYHKTPLHYACEKKFFFSILYLLDTSINYDVEDSQGNTPLAICLRHRMLNQAALLIRKGVRYGYVIEDKRKYSYFEYAVTKLSVGICFMLLDHGYPLQKALEEVENEAFKRELRRKYLNSAQ